jgi:hypothetical protein
LVFGETQLRDADKPVRVWKTRLSQTWYLGANRARVVPALPNSEIRISLFYESFVFPARPLLV